MCVCPSARVLSVSVCVCVCVSERDRERELGSNTDEIYVGIRHNFKKLKKKEMFPNQTKLTFLTASSKLRYRVRVEIFFEYCLTDSVPKGICVGGS